MPPDLKIQVTEIHPLVSFRCRASAKRKDFFQQRIDVSFKIGYNEKEIICISG